MDKNNKPITVIGQVIDVAENTTYIELTSRVCYYNEPNLNGDMLSFDDNSETIAASLVNQPVQAKYRVNQDGNPTFGSHEMHKKKDGSIVFDTVSIGTHIKAWIENDNVTVNDGSIKELPCLFATYRLWKRYPNMIAAAKRLYGEGKLYNSWEINTYQYLYDNGIRKITNYEFIADTLLGYEYAYPSYGTSANAVSMAQINENQLLIAEALSQDLIKENNKEEHSGMLKQNNSIAGENEAETSVNTASSTSSTDNGNNSVQGNPPGNSDRNGASVKTTAQLTEWDLRDKIREACRAKLGKWCYVSYHFPVEKEVWCEYDGAESELDYVKFTYTVADDVVSVSEPVYVKLTVSVAEINAKVSELQKEIETAKAELELKNEAITKASETIQGLNTQVSELIPYKEQAEAAEKKKIEDQIAAEKKGLKQKLLKGNLFTEAEIAEKKIQDLIEARNVSAINSLIADKFVASFDTKETAQDSTGADSDSISEETVTAAANLETEDVETDVRRFMGNILFK